MSVKCTVLIWELESISAEKKLVLLALADNANDTGECWPGLERVRKKCGYKSIRGLQLTINKLVELKFLTVNARKREKDRGQTSNLYTLNLDLIRKMINEHSSPPLNHSSSPPRTGVHPPPELEFIPPPEPQFTGGSSENPKLSNPIKDMPTSGKKELSILTNILTKEEAFTLPEGLLEEKWKAFETFRKEIKHPLTPMARKLILKDLNKFRANGQDINQIIDNSIMNGWRGVFEIKSTVQVKPSYTQDKGGYSAANHAKEHISEKNIIRH
jgi:hypothetical protein